MRALWIVLGKEVLENLRDRRVIFSAFFFGVLLAPVVFAVTTTMVTKRAARDQDQLLKLPVAGHAEVPNLLSFLRENGIEVQPVEYSADQAMRVVRDGEQELVLIVPPEYGEKLGTGKPAPLDLVVDTSNNRSGAAGERVRRLLEAYGRQLGTLRLLVRGIDPRIIAPVDVQMVDIATPAGRALLLLGMMTYFCLMSMLVGGFYLAIDTTAGERERGSLEALLCLPVGRSVLILGKIMATGVFMAVSLLLTLVAFGMVLKFIPLAALGMAANFGFDVVLAIFGVMVVFVPLGAGLLTAVASFTRSNREAQTWLSVVLLIPLAPIMLAVLNGTKSSAALMAVPSLSQHLLATALMRGDALDPLHLAISIGSTLAVGAAFIAAAVLLYRREAILG